MALKKKKHKIPEGIAHIKSKQHVVNCFSVILYIYVCVCVCVYTHTSISGYWVML